MSVVEHSEVESNAVERTEKVLLEWTVHLLRRDPRRAWGVGAAMAFAAAFGLLLMGSPVLALVGISLIFFSAAEYLLPIRHRLTTTRAICAYGLTRYEIPWNQVRRVLQGKSAMKLSPLARESRLDAFRGVLLRFAPEGEQGQREDVARVVEAQIQTGVQVIGYSGMQDTTDDPSSENGDRTAEEVGHDG